MLPVLLSQTGTKTIQDPTRDPQRYSKILLILDRAGKFGEVYVINLEVVSSFFMELPIHLYFLMLHIFL